MVEDAARIGNANIQLIAALYGLDSQQIDRTWRALAPGDPEPGGYLGRSWALGCGLEDLQIDSAPPAGVRAILVDDPSALASFRSVLATHYDGVPEVLQLATSAEAKASLVVVMDGTRPIACCTGLRDRELVGAENLVVLEGDRGRGVGAYATAIALESACTPECERFAAPCSDDGRGLAERLGARTQGEVLLVRT